MSEVGSLAEPPKPPLPQQRNPSGVEHAASQEINPKKPSEETLGQKGLEILNEINQIAASETPEPPENKAAEPPKPIPPQTRDNLSS